jgi:hypothetical protein
MGTEVFFGSNSGLNSMMIILILEQNNNDIEFVLVFIGLCLFMPKSLINSASKR